MSALLDRTFVEAAPPNKESTTLQGWGRRPRSMVTEMTVSGIRRKCPTLLVAFFRRSAAGRVPLAATAKIDHFADVGEMVGDRVSRPSLAAFALLMTAALPHRLNQLSFHDTSPMRVEPARFDTFSISLWNSLSTRVLKSVPIW